MVSKQAKEDVETSDPHDRGTFTHPEDGKKHRHPSSLESFHHIGHDGKPVYSRAQLEALDRSAKALETLERHVEEIDKGPKPAFLTYKFVREDVKDARPAAAEEIDEHSVLEELEEQPIDDEEEAPSTGR